MSGVACGPRHVVEIVQLNGHLAVAAHALDIDRAIFLGCSRDDRAVFASDRFGFEDVVFFDLGFGSVVCVVLILVRAGAHRHAGLFLFIFRIALFSLRRFRGSSDQCRYPGQGRLKLRAIAREFGKPDCLTISDGRGLVVHAVQIDRKNCDFVTGREFRQFFDHRLADFFAFEKAAGAIIA